MTKSDYWESKFNGIDPKHERERHEGWRKVRKREQESREGLDTRISEHVSSAINAPYASGVIPRGSIYRGG
jgi:hypothetical protein